MAIEYSCICRETTVVASHQEGYGDFHNNVLSNLPSISSRQNGKTSFTADNYTFHVLVENGFIFICAAEPSFGKQKPYTYLSEIKKRLLGGNLATRAISAGPNELNREFKQVMADQMEKCSKGIGGGHMSVLQGQVDEVKGVMGQNIEKVLERGERLEDLIDKTDELQASSMVFHNTAKKISRKYWWKNTKMTILFVGIGIVVVIVIVIIILFSTHILPPSSSSDSTTIAPSA